jgi:hypothetical protein
MDHKSNSVTPILDKYHSFKLSRGIWTGQCAHCKQAFTENTIVCAVDHPFFMVLHEACLPFYNYEGGYPHPYPLSYYSQNAHVEPHVFGK